MQEERPVDVLLDPNLDPNQPQLDKTSQTERDEGRAV